MPQHTSRSPASTSLGPDGITARGLRMMYGRLRALDGVDLDIPKGAFLTVFGPNGAGKSTLVRILAALTRPTSGTASILGHDIHRDPQGIRALTGVISHEPYLYGSLTALENLVFFARMYDVEDPGARAHELLGEVGLNRRAHDTVRTFSRGMKQRLAVARSIVHDPGVLLLDEPYTGLDQNGAEIFTQMLSGLKSQGRTIVLTTHSVEEGLGLSDMVCIIDGGRVVYTSRTDGLTPAELKESYKELVRNPGRELTSE